MKTNILKLGQLFVIFLSAFCLPFSCKNDSPPTVEKSVSSTAYDENKLNEFTDLFLTKLASTKSSAYLNSNTNQQLDILLKGTEYNRESFQEWAKSLNLAGKSIANARTTSNVSFSEEQKVWITKIETETANATSKDDCYNSLNKIEVEVKQAPFKSDKTPILVAINIAKATVEKAFEDSKDSENTPNGRVAARCGFWRWTCIVSTTAVIGALGYIAGGVVGGGVLAVAAYDIAKCCICCPDSCDNSWFCYFIAPNNEEIVLNENHLLYS